MNQQLRMLLISGSTRRPSFTTVLAERIEAALVDRGVKTVIWKLSERTLPIADPIFHHEPWNHPAPTVRELVRDAQEADAFIFVSPVYHNSYSGVLKNALDHLAIEQFSYKPVGLAGHGGNRTTQAVDHLRIVIRGLRGVAIPAQVCTAREDFAQTPDGIYIVQSQDIVERIESLANEITVLAHSLRLLRTKA